MDSDALKGIDFSKMMASMTPAVPKLELKMPEIPQIDPKSTVQYKIQEQTKIIIEQNQQLNENYNKLNELYCLKEKELEDSRNEAKAAKKYNTKMLVIAIISSGISLASLGATILIAILGV